MSDLFDEIADDLRHQKLVAFWKENGNALIGGALLAVVLTAGLSFWRGHVERRNEEQTAILLQDLRGNDAAKLASAEQLDKKHAVIAKLSAAAMHLQKGEKEAAVAIYRDIRETSRLDSDWKNLAAVFEAGQTLDTAEPAALHDILKPATAKKSPWRFSALELDALVFAREGKNEDAAESLQQIITDAAAPPDLRTRAQTLHDLYAG